MKASDNQLQRQFVWTSIPTGRVVQMAGKKMALVSLLLTPRLLGRGSSLNVSNFGMQLWPDRLSTIGFRAEVQVQASGPVHVIREVQRVPYFSTEGKEIIFPPGDQLSAWKALLGVNTFVRPYEQKSYANRNVRTFPASDAAIEVREAYGDAASMHLKHRCEAPHLNPELLESLKTLRKSWEAGLRKINDGVWELGPDAPPLARAYDFYRREFHNDFTMPSMHSNPTTTEPEFHDIVTKLADHPLLMRLLGLVIDLALPESELKDYNLLRIIPSWPNPDTNPTPGWINAGHRDICPRTRYELNESRFVPQSTSRIHRGMLTLKGAGLAPSSNPHWEIVQFDVDGAVLRMVGSITDTPREEALPTLRSIGLAIVQRDRKKMHIERTERTKNLSSPQALNDALLDAEDLIGGYRLDVLDNDTLKWRSLCERRVRYKLGNLSIDQEPRPSRPRGILEEGYVRPHSATTGAGATDAIYIHEIGLRWDGWSQAVQRPDRIVEMGVMPDSMISNPPFDSKIEPEPGSLPRLQFGRTYHLRVRVADLAGCGLYLNEVDHEEECTDVLQYRRFEPIPPPEVVPTRKYQDGEGNERLLIRSDRGVSVNDYSNRHGYRPYDLRHILAPKSALELALQHRRTFDNAIGAEASTTEIERLFEVAKRADRELRDIPGAIQVEVETGPNGASYIILPEQGVNLPWLADPMANAIMLHIQWRPINQSTGEPAEIKHLLKKFQWQGEWHTRYPVALRLVTSNAGCEVTDSEVNRTITIALGPAEEVTLEISSCPLSENVDRLGIPGWIGGMSPEQIEQIALGMHRMITPKKTMQLIHAVQRPLRDPGGRLIPFRKVGESICTMSTSELKIHTASTGRIDIHASWEDCDDIVTKEEPSTSKHTMQLGSYDIPYGPLKLPEIRHEFGDTRRRLVKYCVTAVSRFQNFFGHLTATDPKACCTEGQLVISDVPSSARPPAPKLLYTVPTFRWEQSIDGDKLTRLRYGGGLRVFLERPWFSSGMDEALGVLAWRTDWQPPRDLSYVSVAGADPIWHTSAPKFILTNGDINAPVSTQESLPEGEANKQQPVQVYPVQFDKDGKRWYADIDLSKVADSSYFPFVRLAIVRYQANCIPGVDRISAPILTEPIQLPPQRRLFVSRTPGGATIKLDGLSPNGPKKNVIHAEIQVLETGYIAVSPDKDCSGVTEAEADPEDIIAGWSTVYTTSGELGQNLSLDVPTSAQRPMRLMVKEFEIYPPQLSNSGSPIEGNGRLVYADTVSLYGDD